MCKSKRQSSLAEEKAPEEPHSSPPRSAGWAASGGEPSCMTEAKFCPKRPRVRLTMPLR